MANELSFCELLGRVLRAEGQSRATRSVELFEFLRSVISIIRSSPGCLSCRPLRSLDGPAHLAIIEEGESVEAHQNAAKAIPPEKMKEAMTLFAGPSTGTYYKT